MVLHLCDLPQNGFPHSEKGNRQIPTERHSTKYLTTSSRNWPGGSKRDKPEKLSEPRKALGDMKTVMYPEWDPGTERTLGKKSGSLNKAWTLITYPCWFLE